MTRPHSMTDKIWIFVFANTTSLAPLLQQRNIIPKIDMFNDFINGFNSVDELVTFTNVGRGKELTDTKIKGRTPVFPAVIDKMCSFDEYVCFLAPLHQNHLGSKSR